VQIVLSPNKNVYNDGVRKHESLENALEIKAIDQCSGLFDVV
jgi:hypothetical protein